MDTHIIAPPAELARHTTLDGRVLNALERAGNLHHNARQVAPNHYRVYSAENNGSQYDVFITASGLRCNCLAGCHGKPCKHAARVGQRLNREGDGRVY